MTLPAAISLGALALELVLGALCLAFSAAPGWRHLRLFALVAWSAALYSASDVPQTLAVSDRAILAASQLSLSAATLHVALWVLYSARTGRPLGGGRLDRLRVGLLLSASALAWWPGALAAPTVHRHTVAWLGVTYRTADPTPGGVAVFLLVMASVAVPAVRYLRAAREGVPGARAHAAGFAVLAGTAVAETLVAAQVVHGPYVMELGFLSCLLAVVGEMAARLVRDARELAALSTRLEAQVEARGRELATAHLALARADRLAALGRLAAGVAHEINNPLASILGNALFAKAEVERLGPGAGSEAAAALGEIGESAGRIRGIVRDLGTFAREERPGSTGRADVHEVLESALTLVRHEVKHRAQVTRDLCASHPAASDPARLAQVLVGLLGNAAEAIPPGAPERNEIRVRTRSDGREVVVEIEDTGRGVDPADLPHLFEPFFTRRTGAAAGLGLSVCHGIVTALGGRIEVEPGPDGGTRARVTLPAAPA
ncbi:MAG: HAMP domain-containing sensor histidine kinase [Anaeromyxobacteraceae bacterium]